ncbi:hypothetical protein BpHYR1_052569 [Brachionus plicatilis]|uniref:Uncharacterized protein n=1 Tax=Brachionus plicatilis TaxID=10195 RepID=A0A3M7QU66_BRAPC|nr:hypothetical protein BpHYR1_052569 [Brachionus plicatilis]
MVQILKFKKHISSLKIKKLDGFIELTTNLLLKVILGNLKKVFIFLRIQKDRFSQENCFNLIKIIGEAPDSNLTQRLLHLVDDLHPVEIGLKALNLTFICKQ